MVLVGAGMVVLVGAGMVDMERYFSLHKAKCLMKSGLRESIDWQ